MELAKQIISNDKIVTTHTVQDLKDFKLQFLPKQVKKKRKQLFSMSPAIKKSFDLMGDDIEDLSAENESSKKKVLTMKSGWKNLKQSC